MLDSTAYPHILDAIVAFAPEDALIVLRQTSRRLRDRATAILLTHAVLLPEDSVKPSLRRYCTTVADIYKPHALTTPSGALLPFSPSAVHVLDIPSWLSHFPHMPPHPQLSFPNLQTLRRGTGNFLNAPDVGDCGTMVAFIDMTRPSDAHHGRPWKEEAHTRLGYAPDIHCGRERAVIHLYYNNRTGGPTITLYTDDDLYAPPLARHVVFVFRSCANGIRVDRAFEIMYQMVLRGCQSPNRSCAESITVVGLEAADPGNTDPFGAGYAADLTTRTATGLPMDETT